MFFNRSDPRLYKRRPDQIRELRSTEMAADIVRLYMFCIMYNRDLYEDLNCGYLFTLWHNL
jgi:hypothetical protein